MKYHIFSSLFIKQDTICKAREGVIQFPPLRTEAGNIDGVMIANHKDFTLVAGVYELTVEALVKDALNIQIALCQGDTYNNQSIVIRGLTQVRSKPEEIRCCTLNTVFSVSEKQNVSLCFCADRPEITLVAESIWTYYSIKGMLKQISTQPDNKINLSNKEKQCLVDWETRSYKR